MKRLKHEFNISFVALKQGKHKFEYKINKTFFEAFNFYDFLDTDVLVTLNFEKTSTLFTLKFVATGNIKVACDLTNKPFNQPINAVLNLIVKFGNTYNDDSDAVLILPHQACQLNVAQYIYEMLVLAMPAKHVHPGVADGTLKSEILNKLKELQPKQDFSLDKEIDPRWAKLKTLRTVKK